MKINLWASLRSEYQAGLGSPYCFVLVQLEPTCWKYRIGRVSAKEASKATSSLVAKSFYTASHDDRTFRGWPGAQWEAVWKL